MIGSHRELPGLEPVVNAQRLARGTTELPAFWGTPFQVQNSITLDGSEAVEVLGRIANCVRARRPDGKRQSLHRLLWCPMQRDTDGLSARTGEIQLNVDACHQLLTDAGVSNVTCSSTLATARL